MNLDSENKGFCVCARVCQQHTWHGAQLGPHLYGHTGYVSNLRHAFQQKHRHAQPLQLALCHLVPPNRQLRVLYRVTFLTAQSLDPRSKYVPCPPCNTYYKPVKPRFCEQTCAK
jgi:hypothetical protein